MSVEAWLESVHSSSIATTVRETSWFPWLETLHVIAITTLIGTIAVVDLRLLGYPAHRRGAHRLLLEMLPFTWAAFTVAVITGSLLFASNAVTYAANTPFRAKLVLLVLAGTNMAVFHLTAYRNVEEWSERLPPPRGVRIAGAISLVLWIGVVFLGRWIGFTD